jgi:beta-hydroxyacyl-ACP dehydratase FabZ
MLNINHILTQLPHRYPFILVDRVLEMVPGDRIVALKNVTINEPFFQGHFPGLPIMPGVLIIEALAQAGGLLALASIPDPRNKLVFFMSIDKAKFRKPVVPGDQLILEITTLKFKPRVQKVAACAKVDDVVVTEAELMASIGDRE